MSKIVELTILGEPCAKQRPRYSTYGGFVRTYTPQKTINYESLIAHEYNEKYGELTFERDTPIKATIIAYFPLKKSDYGKKGLNKSGKEKIEMGYCIKHLDLDNIIKIVLDGLNSICFVDDKQVVEIVSKKVWTENTPKVVVRLESIYESRV